MSVQEHLVGPLFLRAARSGNLQDVIRLRARLPFIESQREVCYEALQSAAWNGHDNIVSELLGIIYNFSYFLGQFFEVNESAPSSGTRGCWFFYGAEMLSSPLHLAVKEGHLKVVHEIVHFFQVNKVLDHLFDKPSNATQKFLLTWFQCLLEWAVRWGHASIVLLLLTPPFLIATSEAQTIGHISLPVHLAAHHKHLDALQVLLAAAESGEFKELRMYSQDGLTILHLAAQSGSLPIVQFLLQNTNIDVNARSHPDLFTPLHMAANSGHEYVIGFLLQTLNHDIPFEGQIINRKVDLLARDSMGRTAFHYAAREGHQNVVRQLLRENCSIVGILDDDGLLAIHMAAQAGHVQVIRDLKRQPGGVDSTVRHRFTMKSYLKRNFKEKLNINVDTKFPRPRQIDSLLWKTEGFTPLHFAARYGHESVVRELLADTGIQPNLELQDHQGFFSYDWMEVQNKGENFLNCMVEASQGYKDALKQASCVNKMTSKKRSKIARDIEEEKRAMEELEHAWDSGMRPQISMPILRWLMDADEVNIAPEDVDALSALSLALRESSFWIAKEILLLEPAIALDHRLGEIVKQQVSDASGKLDQEMVDFAKALVTNDKLAGASRLLRWMLQWAQRENENGLVEAILERPDLKRGLYEDRQVYLDCANAILVGAALIAGVAFQGWLQPPLGYSGGDYAAVHKGAVRMFWKFNNAAFFFSVATLIAGARGAVPVADNADIVVSVDKVKRAVAVASMLLIMALVCVVGAFICAGKAVLPPIHSDLHMMHTNAGLGAAVCALVLLWFLVAVGPLFIETVRYGFLRLRDYILNLDYRRIACFALLAIAFSFAIAVPRVGIIGFLLTAFLVAFCFPRVYGHLRIITRNYITYNKSRLTIALTILILFAFTSPWACITAFALLVAFYFPRIYRHLGIITRNYMRRRALQPRRQNQERV